MEFILFIVFVVLCVSHMGLRSRVSKLEGEVATRSKILNEGQSTIPKPSVQPLYTQPQEFIPNVVAQSTAEPGPDLGNTFIEWLQKDLFMKIGALFLLMGFGWLVSYAFIHDWIGPVGRIMLGLLSGVGILVLGAWRIRTQAHQGAIFTVLGSTIVLLTVFAARTQYDMFDPYSALVLMFLSVIFVTFVSLKYNRNSLALASLILAAIAPYLTVSASQSLNERFLYLLMIVLGTLWVVYVTGWRNLTLAALIIVGLMTAPYMVSYDEKTLALFWVFIFTAIFFVANIVSLVRQRDGITSQTNLYTALGTALFLVAWIFGVASEETRSLLLVAWMLVFSVGTYLVFRTTNALSPFYVYGGTSIALLAAATTAELQGAVLTIALTFEVAVLVLGAIFLKLESKVVTSLSLLFTGPIIFSLSSIVSRSWNTGVLHADFFNLLILTLILLIVGLVIVENNKVQNADTVGTGGVLITCGVLYGLLLVWLIMHALLSDDVATMFTLIVYTILGLGAYFKGKTEDDHSLRLGGGLLLGFVACHLLIVDVWQMDLVGRIVTFFVVGILLLSTAFMGRQQRAE
jgi:uncharacterized membrane protein